MWVSHKSCQPAASWLWERRKELIRFVSSRLVLRPLVLKCFVVASISLFVRVSKMCQDASWLAQVYDYLLTFDDEVSFHINNLVPGRISFAIINYARLAWYGGNRSRWGPVSSWLRDMQDWRAVLSIIWRYVHFVTLLRRYRHLWSCCSDSKIEVASTRK